MIEVLAERVRAMAAGGRVVVGIVGIPGAGKSTLARALTDELTRHGTPAAYLPMDGFHLPAAELEARGLAGRKGAPDTFDVDGYVDLLTRLAEGAGTAIMVPDYDRELHDVVPGRLLIRPDARVIVTEGNYLGVAEPPWSRVRPLLSELWFLDTPWATARDRLVARRVATGRDPDDAAAWVASVDHANALVVARTVAVADVVVDR